MPKYPKPKPRRKPPWAGPHSPKPDPNPDGQPPRWYMVEYHHAWEDSLLKVALRTDVDAHLWLYWTDVETRMHLREDSDSGVRWKWAPRFCIVELNAVEQNEPGDTEWHTFNFGPWTECQTRWWIFAGYINSVQSPSVSPIMKAHYQTFIKDESMRHIDLTDKNPDGIIDHGDASITPVKLKYPFTFATTPFTPALPPTQDYHVANKKYVDDSIAAIGPSPWIKLVDATFLANATPSVSWSGTYDIIHIILQAFCRDSAFRPYMRINGLSTPNYYESHYIYHTANPLGHDTSYSRTDRWPLAGLDIPQSRPFSFKALATCPIPYQASYNGATILHYNAHQERYPATAYIYHGTLMYIIPVIINSIQFHERLARPFDLRIKVFGSAL